MNYIVFHYAHESKEFNRRQPVQNYMVYVARFVASMWTHIFVEKDIQQGINMMKYVVNHHDNFLNPYAAFMFGLLTFFVSLHVEINAMIAFQMLTRIDYIVEKYVSVAAIVNIPRFYFLSLDYKAQR